jgi:signal recognition particle subunit SEC65
LLRSEERKRWYTQVLIPALVSKVAPAVKKALNEEIERILRDHDWVKSKSQAVEEYNYEIHAAVKTMTLLEYSDYKNQILDAIHNEIKKILADFRRKEG